MLDSFVESFFVFGTAILNEAFSVPQEVVSEFYKNQNF